jgi:hypothetical protein
MACNLYELIDLGTELLDWQLATPEGQLRMAADLRLPGGLQQMTAAEVSFDRNLTASSAANP